MQERAPSARTDVVDERSHHGGREPSSLVSGGGAYGTDLGPVSRMHTLACHADQVTVYPPATIATEIDGRRAERTWLRLLDEGKHLGYVSLRKRRELMRAARLLVRPSGVDHLDQVDCLEFGPAVRNPGCDDRYRRADGQHRQPGPVPRVLLV
jgi:hypothetical protein